MSPLKQMRKDRDSRAVRFVTGEAGAHGLPEGEFGPRSIDQDKRGFA